MTEQTNQELYERIEAFVTIVRELNAQIDAVKDELEPRIKQAKAQMEELLIEYRVRTGKRWQDGRGYAQYKAPHEYYSYPAKELNPLADMEGYEWLRDKRRLVKKKGRVEVQ